MPPLWWVIRHADDPSAKGPSPPSPGTQEEDYLVSSSPSPHKSARSFVFSSPLLVKGRCQRGRYALCVLAFPFCPLYFVRKLWYVYCFWNLQLSERGREYEDVHKGLECNSEDWGSEDVKKRLDVITERDCVKKKSVDVSEWSCEREGVQKWEEERGCKKKEVWVCVKREWANVLKRDRG